MPAPRACPVVACIGTAVGSLVIALLPSAGPGRCRTVTACPSCWRAVGNGAAVHVEYAPGDAGRRSPRVLLGGARRVG